MTIAMGKLTDTTLQTNVLDELKWQPSLNAADIGVTVDDGVVTLTGTVDSYSQRTTAARVVRALHGVRGIANDLTVRLPGKVVRSDSDIAQAALNALDWDVVVPNKDIKVTVDAGMVSLDGTVEWEYQRRSAQRAVEYLSGVTYVTNNIKLEPRVTPADVKTNITQAFERSARVDAKKIQVEVDDSVVTLSGVVDDWDAAVAANRAARAAPGVSRVVDHMAVARNKFTT